ncbi:MAG: hypothetical protein LBI49_25585 [Nocardiopsaceae bacterium]|jgi:hypothetical protein|nr:hypothetical protein [Nocardiopsaceae bacterium]
MAVRQPPASDGHQGLASDLGQLRGRFPGWFFTSVWAAAGSGPDRRLLVGQRRGIVLSDWSTKALAAKIRAEDGG